MFDFLLFAVALILAVVVAVDLRRAGPGIDLELIFQLAFGAAMPERIDDDLRDWLEAPEVAPQTWLGPDLSWSDWAAQREPVVEAARQSFEHHQLLVFSTPDAAPAAEALAVAAAPLMQLQQTAVPPSDAASDSATGLEQAAEALVAGLPGASTRVWAVAVGGGGERLFRLLHIAPALRDRLRGVVFWGSDLSAVADLFEQDAFDLELNRTVPYLWVHSEVAHGPLEEPPVPPSGRKPVMTLSLGSPPTDATEAETATALLAVFLAAQRAQD